MEESDRSLATAEVLSGGQLARATRMDRRAASGRPVARAAHAARYDSSASRASWEEALNPKAPLTALLVSVAIGRKGEVDDEVRRAVAWPYSTAAMAASISANRVSGDEGKVFIASKTLQPCGRPLPISNVVSLPPAIRVGIGYRKYLKFL